LYPEQTNTNPHLAKPAKIVYTDKATVQAYEGIKMVNFKKGFTLAEVLVTLAIIGVVSALTVPGLMNSYQKQTYVTQLHKVYNESMQALTQYQTDRFAVNLFEAGLNSQANVNSFVENYFKIINTCTNSLTPCFPMGYKTMNGVNVDSQFVVASSYVLASGASVRFLYNSNKTISIMVDVNGSKGPNIVGRDLFLMSVHANGMIDEFSSNTAPLTTAERNTLFNQCNSTAVWGCFGKILNDNWQMTY